MPLLTFQEERAGREAGVCVCIVCCVSAICALCVVLCCLCHVCVETRGSAFHTLLPLHFQ